MTVHCGTGLSRMMIQLKTISWSIQACADIAVRSVCKHNGDCIVMRCIKHVRACCHWQVAQTVSHVTWNHMSSSGVMHEINRWCEEEMVRHEVKKKNIAAVNVQYCNSHYCHYACWCKVMVVVPQLLLLLSPLCMPVQDGGGGGGVVTAVIIVSYSIRLLEALDLNVSSSTW